MERENDAQRWGTRNGDKLYTNISSSNYKGECKLNKMPNDSIIVIDMAENIVKIRVFGQHLIGKIQAMGFSLIDEFMILPVSDDQDKQRIIRLLISEGALFLYGHGWYPSEVMEYYKEQHVDFDKYKIIYWADKDTYHIEER